jgi:hypothetical protein
MNTSIQKVFLATLFVIALIFFGLPILAYLAGCAQPAIVGETKTEARLDTDQSKQLSAARASVDAASGAAAAAQPEPVKVAVVGELGVAQANLPPATPVDEQAATDRVNDALSGKLAAAQQSWQEAVARGDSLSGQVASLQKQLVAERAAAAVAQEKANERLCVMAALETGGGLFAAAALALAAGMYFGLPKLEYAAAGLALCAVAAFFAATQVGSGRFDLLAMLVLGGGVGALVYAVWSGFEGGGTIATKATGFDAAFSAIEKFAEDIAADAETDAKKLWVWLETELDAAHKALVTDWDKLAQLFKRSSSVPVTTTVKS